MCSAKLHWRLQVWAICFWFMCKKTEKDVNKDPPIGSYLTISNLLMLQSNLDLLERKLSYMQITCTYSIREPIYCRFIVFNGGSQNCAHPFGNVRNFNVNVKKRNAAKTWLQNPTKTQIKTVMTPVWSSTVRFSWHFLICISLPKPLFTEMKKGLQWSNCSKPSVYQ